MKNAKWVIAFALLVVLCLAVIFLRGALAKPAKTARVIQDGEVIRKIDLAGVTEPYEFEVVSSDGGHNTIRVENGKIAVVSADCPDKICVNQGFIENGEVPIVCLPHRLSVVIDSENEIDAVSGGMPK